MGWQACLKPRWWRWHLLWVNRAVNRVDFCKFGPPKWHPTGDPKEAWEWKIDEFLLDEFLLIDIEVKAKTDSLFCLYYLSLTINLGSVLGGRCWYRFTDHECVGMFRIQHSYIANHSNLCSPRDALLNAAALLSSQRDSTRDVEFALENKGTTTTFAKDSLEKGHMAH